MNGFVTGLVTGVLSVGAIALSPGPDVNQRSRQRRGPEQEQLEQTFHIDVFLRDAMFWRDNAESREVQIVRDCLYPILNHASEPADYVDAVRAALSANFASHVVFEEIDSTYKAIWDAERMEFRIICCDALAIEVDVDGTIVSVPVVLGTFLD